MADLDVQIGRGEGGVFQTLRKGGGQSQEKFFSALQASVWFKNKAGQGGGGGGGAGPSPVSATET